MGNVLGKVPANDPFFMKLKTYLLSKNMIKFP